MSRSKSMGDAIRRKLAKDEDLAEAVENARLGFNVASEVYRVRTELDLTQRAFAELLGTQQSVIARLEDAEYDGHSVRFLRRIAKATGKRLDIRFIDAVPCNRFTEVDLVEEKVTWSEPATEWDHYIVEDCLPDHAGLSLAVS